MLDENNFGHWKVRMKQRLKGIDEDVWTAVEVGWSEPTVKTEEGVLMPKTKENWTEADKLASKFNSKAISEIFNAIDPDQFKLIQGCMSAKAAWDTLVDYYEGTDDVKRTRLDYLASQFENLRMTKDESVTTFSSKLTSIANEASVLGKTYKDKKLVKKLIRCLPEKFTSYKAMLKVGMNTDEMKFSQLVGILKAEEMESPIKQPKKLKDIAFTVKKETDQLQALHKSLDQNIEDHIGLLARNFKDTLKRIESRQGRSLNSHRGMNQTSKRSDVQCYECEGVGHYKSDCPLTKRKELKCGECQGCGHTKTECPNLQKKDDQALLSFSDTDSDREDDEDEILNMVALVSKKEVNNSDSDDDEEIDPKVKYRKLYDSWLVLSNENLKLLQNKAVLEAQINILEMEKPVTSKLETSICSRSDNELHMNTQAEQENTCELEAKINRLSYLLSEEKEKSRSLEHSLSDNHKKIRMLNTGTKDLDAILAMGQPPKVNWGLGYKENRVSNTHFQTGLISFVRAEPVLVESVRVEPVSVAGTKEVVQSTPEINKVDNFMSAEPCVVVKAKNEVQQLQQTYKGVETDNCVKNQRFNKSCYSCGRRGHSARYCYERINNIRQAWKQNNCFIEPRYYGKFWIAKSVMYSKDDKDSNEDDIEVICNSAMLNQKPEYIMDKLELTASQQFSENIDGSKLVKKPHHV